MKTISTTILALGVCFGVTQSSEALAQSHDLQYAQAGALLTYAQAELNLLYAALTDKQFDPKLTKDTIDELNRSLQDAKKRIDRTIALLPENKAKAEPDLEKLRAQIKTCQDSLTKLANDIEEQTAAPSDEEGGLGEPKTNDDELPAEEGAQRDWELLKRGTGWLGVDLAAARKSYARLARKVGVRRIKTPPKPRGKRPE